MVKLRYKQVHQCYTFLCVWYVSMYACICVFMHMEHRGWSEVSYLVVLHYIFWHRVSHWAQRSPVWLHRKPWGSSCVYFLGLGLKHTQYSDQAFTRELEIWAPHIVWETYEPLRIVWERFYWLTHLSSHYAAALFLRIYLTHWKKFHNGFIDCLFVDIYQIYQWLVILSTILELLELVENRYLWAKIFEKKKKWEWRERTEKIGE